MNAGKGGARFTYVEAWKAFDIANEVFQYNGWSCSIVNLNLEHVRVLLAVPVQRHLAVLSRFPAAPQIDAKNGRYTACATAIVRVTVRRVSRVQNHGVCSPRACACVRAPLQLRDGVSHEDVGCGCSERQPSKSAAIENAKKVCVVAGLCGCGSVWLCVCACAVLGVRVCA